MRKNCQKKQQMIVKRAWKKGDWKKAQITAEKKTLNEGEKQRKKLLKIDRKKRKKDGGKKQQKVADENSKKWR